MADLSELAVSVDAEQAKGAVGEAMREVMARELHDVVFTFGKPIPEFDRMQPETQEWFRGRADRILHSLLGDAE